MPIRKRGDRYQVRVTVAGRRVERTLPPGATRADALDAEAHLRRQQVDLAAGRRLTYTLDEAIDRWEQTSACRLKSYQKDLRYRIRALREWTAGRTLDEIPVVADKLKADGIASGLSAAGINRYLSILRRVGNLAVQWDWTDKPLGQRVVLLPGEKSRHVYLTPRQVKALIAACPNEEAADFIMFAALTGLRRSEVLGLRPENLVDGAVVLDAVTKSGKPRIVPMPLQAARIAQERVPWSISARMLRDYFDVARAAVGLPDLRLHDLRHSFASWLAQGGQSLTAIRDLLGHSSLAVTSRYAHLARPDLVKATKKLRV